VGKFLLVVVLFGVVTYAVVWTIMRRQAAGRGDAAHGPALGRRTPPPKQVAPDDDEDFLRWLERRQRSARPESPRPPAGGAPSAPSGETGEGKDAGQEPDNDPGKGTEKDPDTD
jgi:hypothetical protein